MNKKSILQKAYLIRQTEEQLLELFSKGYVHGTIHTCVGQEMSPACLSEFLRADDYIFSNHRGHGHYLACTQDLKGLVGEVLGRENGSISGVGGSQHLQFGNFYSNGIQGGIVPLAAGAAYGLKLSTKDSIAVVFIGDGTLGEGALYETLNIASRWNLPLLIVLEDNGYAQSTSKLSTFAGDLKKRIEGFGVHYTEANTTQWESLHKVFESQVTQVRLTKKPHFIAVNTFRLRAHSKGDDQRDPLEIQNAMELDPLNSLLQQKDSLAVTCDADAKQLVHQAIHELKLSPAPQVNLSPTKSLTWLSVQTDSTSNYLQALNSAFLKLFKTDQNLYFIGEDVEDPYGGCFKVSRGLSSNFGDRVKNTPISESAITGIGTGLSMTGKSCFVEYMFGDFTSLAFDQILNHAAKFREIYKNTPLQVFFRTPMGNGKGYGPTHSQNLEKHFLGIPGLQVYSLNAFTPPFEFLKSLIEKNAGPTLIVENKKLYQQNLEFLQDGPWTVTREKDRWDLCLKWRGSNPHLQLIANGYHSQLIVEAAKILFTEHEITSNIFIATQLSDFDIKPFAEEWKKIPMHILFEEGQGYASFSSEVAAQMGEYGIINRRWAAPQKAIPAAPSLESEFQLSIGKIIAECLEVCS